VLRSLAFSGLGEAAARLPARRSPSRTSLRRCAVGSADPWLRASVGLVGGALNDAGSARAAACAAAPWWPHGPMRLSRPPRAKCGARDQPGSSQTPHNRSVVPWRRSVVPGTQILRARYHPRPGVWSVW